MAVSLASAGSAVLRSSSNRSPRVQDGHLSPHRCWSGRIVTPQRLTQRLKAGPTDVLLLDFDGVIVDSEPEVTAGCIESAAALWSQSLSKLEGAQLAELKNKMRTVRPVMNATWEFLVAARLLASDAKSLDSLLQDWPSVCDWAIKEWGTTQHAIEEHSEAFRKQRVAGDEGAFIQNNMLYPGILDAVSQCQYPWLYAKLSPPNEKKIAAISDIAQRPLVNESKARLHFVDDRFETVKAVLEAPDLKGIRLKVYLAD
ncbi:hypothetical protein WJX84_005680, partial [Apatococcus fuscideae]